MGRTEGFGVNEAIGVELEEFMRENEGLIKLVANRALSRSTYANIEFDDLYQIAAIGFIQAYDRFDTSFGTKFSTYAVPKMWGELQRYFRDHGSSIKFARSITECGRILSRKGIEELDSSEILEILAKEGIDHVGPRSVDKKLIEDAQYWLFYKHPKSTNTVMHSSDGDDITLLDMLGNPEDTSALHVQEMLQQLPDNVRQSFIYHAYGLKQREIGEILGVSQVQVSRNVQKARKMLKELYGEVPQ